MNFIKRLLTYTRKYKFLFLLLIGLVILENGAALLYPLFIKEAIDKVFLQRDWMMLNIIALGLLFVYAFRSLIVSLRIITANKVQNGVILSLRNHVYSNLQKLSLSYFEKRRSGLIVSRVITDVEAMQSVITSGLVTAISSLLTLILTLIILVHLNWKLTLVTMIPMPFLAFLFHNFMLKAHSGYKKVRRKIADVTALLQENISGIKEIKSFAQENYERDRFIGKVRKNFIVNMKIAKLWASFYPFVLFFSSLGVVIILWYGGKEVIAGELSLGSLVAFLSYLNIFYAPVRQLNVVLNQFQHARAAGERVFNIIDEIPKVKEVPNAISFHHPLRGKIQFDNVFFKYDETNAPVLKNITFHIEPGEIVALVGPSGSGKTTIVSLIPRFYDTSSGSITIDGYDIRKFKFKYLRQQIGMVLQESFLFNGTIVENILFGNPKAKMEDVIESAKAANAHDFIINLPNGYNTEVGERGIKLSGGERQRIAIARALLKNPPILILDEATSSVDSETERLIQSALDRLMKGRTSIVIAHRLSTIKNADRIIVLKNGEIIETGTHSELLEKGNLYSYLYKIQFDIEGIKKEMPLLLNK